MNASTRKKTLFRVAIPGLATLALAALTLTACNSSTTKSSDDPCKDDATLCTPRATLIDSGAAIFAGTCGGCHGELGNGDGHGGPRLANSNFLMNNRTRVITILLRGNQDTVHVNGACINGGGMQAGGGNDEIQASNFRIAAVLTWLRAVRNDSTVTNCTAPGVCTKTARTPAEIAADSVAVWEVKAVRDTLKPYPESYTPTTCPE